MAQHERVKRVYAHITDPLAAVELPERCKGAVLGLGGETDAEWRKRASEAATDALKGVQARWHRGVREKGLDEAEMLARTTQAVNRKVEEMEERPGAPDRLASRNPEPSVRRSRSRSAG